MTASLRSDTTTFARIYRHFSITCNSETSASPFCRNSSTWRRIRRRYRRPMSLFSPSSTMHCVIRQLKGDYLFLFCVPYIYLFLGISVIFFINGMYSLGIWGRFSRFGFWWQHQAHYDLRKNMQYIDRFLFCRIMIMELTVYFSTPYVQVYELEYLFHMLTIILSILSYILV